MPRNTAIAVRFRTALPVDPFPITLRQAQTGAQVFLTQTYVFVGPSRTDLVYKPVSTLAASTNYIVQVTSSGSSPYQFSFTTGAVSDTVAPHLLSVSPGPNDGPIDPSGPVLFRFDKALMTPAFPTLTDGVGVFFGEALTSLSSDRRTLEVRPTPHYRLPRVLEITFDPNFIRDMAGNPSTGPIKARATTTLGAGTRGPAMIGQFPDSGDTNVPTNAVVQLLFDHDLYASSVNQGGIVLETGSGPVQFQSQTSGARVMLTGVALLPNTTYKLRTTNRLLDANGIASDQPVQFEFTTTGGPAPTTTESVATGPPFGTLAPVNAKLVIRSPAPLPSFAPLLFGTLFPQSSGTRAFNFLNASVTLSDDRRILVITPRDVLNPFTSYGADLSILTDIFGRSVVQGTNFDTSGDRDDDAPQLIASTPADGASNVPVTTTLQIVINKTIGLMTPSSSIRLIKDGERWIGKTVISGPRIEFRPDRQLEPSADYVLEAEGIAGLAGNAGPLWSVQFHTAGDSTPPREFPNVIRTTLQAGDPGPQDVLEFQFNVPIRAGGTNVSVTMSVPRVFDSPRVFGHPFRTEIAGDTVRVIPLIPWASARTYNITIETADLWGRFTYYSASFRPGPSSDTVRPEVVSIIPAPGTPITAGQTIQLIFSEPMLEASQLDGGLVIAQSGNTSFSGFHWSDDRRSITIGTSFADAQPASLSGPVAVVASSGMVDLAGNPLNAVTARFPVLAPAPLPAQTPNIVWSWPPRDVPLDVRAPVAFYFSSPVDAAVFNDGVWLVTSRGRTVGSWQVSSDGLLATFRPQGLWPAGDFVRVLQTGVLGGQPLLREFSTLPAPTIVPKILRTSLTSSLPANAVIDVEFDQPAPSGTIALRLQSRFETTTIACDETRPRPNVRRLQPRSPLTPGTTIQLLFANGTSTPSYGDSITVTAPLLATPVDARYRFPLPDAGDVPFNARAGLVMSGALNALSVNESTVKLSSGGRAILAQVTAQQAFGSSFKITPLEPLPADQTIDVRVDGIEDRLGRPLAPLAWSFRTSNRFDISAPVVVSSNIPANAPVPTFDSQSPVRLQFSEPLDPAAIDQALANTAPGDLTWDLSADFQMLSVRPARGWRHGESNRFNAVGCDWSGNCVSFTPSEVAVGFDDNSSPPALQASSIQDGQVAVPLNVKFGLLFDRPVASDQLRSIRLMRDGESIRLRFGDFSGSGRFGFSPDSPLDPNTSYQLIIDGLRSGTPQTIGFTTGDRFETRSVAATFYFLGATAPLRVRFSQPVDATTILTKPDLLSWVDLRGGSGYTRNEPVSIKFSTDGLELTIVPQNPLRVGVAYSVNLRGVIGLAATAISPDTFTFQPKENQDTSVVRVTIFPQDGSTNVPTNVFMEIVCSRKVDIPAIRLVERDQVVLTTAMIAQTALLLQRALQPSTSYRIEVDGFNDEFGNAIPPVSSSFVTGPPINNSPPFAFVSSTPANNEAGVAPDTPLTVAFNRPLAPVVFLDFGPQATRPIPYRFTTEVRGSQFTVQPVPSWPAASSINFTMNPTTYFGTRSVTDWAGNGLRQSINLSFRTAAINDPEPPVLESASPAAGTTIPGDLATIALRFSKPVGIGTDALLVYYGSQRTTINGIYSEDFRTITLQLRPPANSRVTIVGTDGIRDNADNPLAPFVLEYPTGENLPAGSPQVSLVEPRNAQTYPATTTVLIRFDRAMNSDSVIPAFRLTQNGDNVSGAVEVSEGGRAYRFRPASPFPAGATVRVFVLATASDPEGRTVQPNFFPLATFFIDGTAPAPLSITMRGFRKTAPADAILELEFNAELDRSSVNGDSVWLRRGRELIGGRASLRDGSVLQFIPDSALQAGENYVLTAGAALATTDGRNFAGQDFHFLAVPFEESAAVESAELTNFRGQPALRVRFTHPVSPLAARKIGLEQNGAPVHARVLPSTDHSEVWLVPLNPDDAGEWTVSVRDVPGRNGRPIVSRRISVSSSQRQVR